MGSPHRVAVIGAGLMGHGIAQVFAQHGCSVALHDVNEGSLKSAPSRIRANLELLVEMGIEDESIFDRVMPRIRTAADLRDALHDVEFVTEAVLENLDLKKEVFKAIDAATDGHVVMASNTSTLPMTEVGKGLKKADRLLITHWFNPPHLIPVVEVLRAEATSEEAFTWTFEFLESMGKTPVYVRKQVPGFLVNRIQTAMFREIVGLLEAGVASAEDIDKAVSGSFGLRLAAIGPLATVDLAGVDLWHKGAKGLYPEFDDSREPQRLLTEMVEKGFHGIKAGKGFFDYGQGSSADIVKTRDIRLLRIMAALKEGKEHEPAG